MITKWLRPGINSTIQGLFGLLLTLSVGPAEALDLFTPPIYTMPPQQLEQLRSELGTIGVAVSPRAGKQKILMPAKGPWGGFVRGLAAGATFPVAIGFVSPIPGGTLLGILVAPITTVAGGVYGAATAAPAEEVEQAEAEIHLAEQTLRDMGLDRVLMTRLIDLGRKNTKLSFVPLPDAELPGPEETARYDQLDLSGATSVLEIRSNKIGLRGFYGINPQTSVFIELDVRLIRLSDKQILLTEFPSCSSVGKRKYVQWAEQEGQLIVAEITTCLSELAEKIIDDFFLVYPTQSP